MLKLVWLSQTFGCQRLRLDFQYDRLYSCLHVCLEVSQGVLARTCEDEVSKKAWEMTEWLEHRELSSMDS